MISTNTDRRAHTGTGANMQQRSLVVGRQLRCWRRVFAVCGLLATTGLVTTSGAARQTPGGGHCRVSHIDIQPGKIIIPMPGTTQLNRQTRIFKNQNQFKIGRPSEPPAAGAWEEDYLLLINTSQNQFFEIKK